MVEPGSATPFQRSGETSTVSAGLGVSRFGRTIRQRYNFFRCRSHWFAGRIRIIRRTLPASTLAQHASQSQEDEDCECQENDGVDVEHVSHAFGYRGGTSAGYKRFRPVAGWTTERPASLHLPGGHANPKGRASRQHLARRKFRSLDRTLDDQDAQANIG